MGTIPSDVYRLSQLRYLNLEANNFTGDIPAAVGRLSELTTLHLASSLYNGSFPLEIGNLSNLEELVLGRNYFAPSTIPSSFFTKLKKLRNFFMPESSLIGEIPESIGNLIALEFLDLSYNGLSGKIPDSLFLLKNLTKLFLYNNRLSGPIPRSVKALNLDVIDLSSNNLIGTIPDDFGELTKLTGLALFLNQLSGEVPTSMGKLPSLQNFGIFSNNLSGELPPDFGLYSTLKTFQVSSNKFVGKLPENLCHNGMLRGIVAFENNLSGGLPKSLGNCSSLKVVEVYDNQFSGEIPDGLWTSFNLTTLMIKNNLFRGQLPNRVSTNLSLLEIQNNRFSGGIPVEISSWKNLREFIASNNLFEGTIPQELTSLPFLMILSLDKNQLSGPLPEKIISWTSLSSLNLSRNHISGPIPAQIGTLPRLIDLDLSENEFSGQIPPEIGHLNLIMLNLSSNRLIGRIPGEIEMAFSNSSFFNNTALCSNKPSLGINSCNSKPRKSREISPEFITTIASIAVVLFVLAILFLLYVIFLYRKTKQGLDSKWKLTSFQRLNFTETTILSRLTENNVIGSGGSGKVYRVPINRSDEYVAVKKIGNNKKMDQNLVKEFHSEVEVLSTIRHSNIVKLLCCISNENSKLIVYQYMENRSLDRWLHGKKRPSNLSASVHHNFLDWPKRLQIAVGAARGLCYLHHDCSPPIVHRDVKSSNVLLDSEFNAKIADFGLAKILVNHGDPCSVSVVAGSFGYLAPEYAHATRVNEKIDVYSFGVILLELVTGREANDGGNNMVLADWAWRNIQDSKQMIDALDEDIREPTYLNEMINVYKLGIICTGTLPSTRPSMKEVLKILLQSCHLTGFNETNNGVEVDSFPLLKNSKRERSSEHEDGGHLSII